ncbi:hypothetical protein [Kribbella sp. VKM Ac-2568]|uniref:hypothetical protein n=1 Tax=Kribbella sp. VKM Ac-2568 TaxID=2512219 RepID=UPI00104F09F9|nr:hypothetical protein [Kribbella sp. VKM Ac-2568]TCM38950.1 hypothetical protein EV648_11567 [Kribbella sp. VKM Ac-2568]
MITRGSGPAAACLCLALLITGCSQGDQALTGILQARYHLNGVDAALEESRRIELQASCLAGVYLAADRKSFPITADWAGEYDYLVHNTDDPERDHGRRANHGGWSLAGIDTGDPAACNTYLAASPLVS